MYCSLEKEALESSLFEVQRQLAQLESRREQLEADGRALLLAKEALTGRQAWGKGRGTAGSNPDCAPWSSVLSLKLGSLASADLAPSPSPFWAAGSSSDS